ncbi:MAG: biopolymer transporter ExbD [Rubrivivax sp.]
MAFGRLERSPGAQPMSEINMTPLIDVMLVLLVIFIITAPLIAGSLKLDLPRAEGATAGTAPAFIAVALDAEGRSSSTRSLADAAALAERARRAARRNLLTEVAAAPTGACRMAASPS